MEKRIQSGKVMVLVCIVSLHARHSCDPKIFRDTGKWPGWYAWLLVTS